MSLTLITAPSTEPLDLQEVKDHLHVTADTEDELLTAMIIAARGWAEHETGRALITQTWEMRLDSVADLRGAIALPKPPLQSVGSLKYIDTNGALQTWSSALYQVTGAGGDTLARIGPIYAGYWPYARSELDAVRIVFTAGYGTQPNDVPEPIRLAMKQVIAHWYANRGEAVQGSAFAEVPVAAKWLLAVNKVY